MLKRAFLLGLLGTAGIALPLIAEPATRPATRTAPADPTDPAQIARAIDDLNDLDPKVREHASQSLADAGPAAETALQQASESDDPEMAGRARKLLRDLKMGIRPDTPERIIEALQRYRDGDPDEQNKALLTLLDDSRDGTRIAMFLYSSATGDAERENIYNKLISYSLGTAVRLAISLDDLDLAEKLLRDGSAASGDARDYAAFLLQTDRLPAAIVALETTKLRPKTVDRQLAWLYRTAGDLPSAIDAASRTGDANLVRDLTIERDGPRVVAERYRNAPLESVDDVCLRVGSAVLLDDPKMLDAATDAAVDWLELHPGDVWAVTRALLKAGRHERATAVMKKNGLWSGAMAVLAGSGRQTEAVDLVDEFRHKLDDPDQGMIDELTYMRAMAVIALVELGEKKQAVAAADALMADIAPQDGRDAIHRPSAVVQMRAAVAEEALGRVDRAFTHFAAAMKVGDADRTPGELLGILYYEQSAQARLWWDVLATDPKLTTDRQRFDAVRRLLKGKAGAKELDARVAAAQRHLQEGHSEEQAIERLSALVDTLVDYHQDAQAETLLRSAADRIGKSKIHPLLAEHFADRGRWSDAADVYGQLVRRQPQEHRFAYAYAVALQRLGRDVEAKKLIRRARLLCLGDDQLQTALLEQMERAGDTASMASQVELLQRTAAPGLGKAGEGLRLGVESLRKAGKYRNALGIYEDALLGGYLSSADDHPRVWFEAARTNWLRAGAAVQEGRLAEAVDQAERALKLPSHDEDLIGVINAFDAAGHKAEADRIFQKNWAPRRARLKQYPDRRLELNNLAWVAARCGRELPAAEEMVAHALKLDPQSTMMLDTHAEVLFRQGRREEALKAIEQCIQLRPREPYYRQQRERFQNAP